MLSPDRKENTPHQEIKTTYWVPLSSVDQEMIDDVVGIYNRILRGGKPSRIKPEADKVLTVLGRLDGEAFVSWPLGSKFSESTSLDALRRMNMKTAVNWVRFRVYTEAKLSEEELPRVEKERTEREKAEELFQKEVDDYLQTKGAQPFGKVF